MNVELFALCDAATESGGKLNLLGAFDAEGDEGAVANLILNFQQLRFAAYGRYSIDLAVDGRQEGSLPLYLRPVPQDARPQP